MFRLPIIEPNLGRFENSYRQAFLKSDALQAIFVIALSNIASLTLIHSDYESFGPGAEFFMFFIARVTVFIVSSLAIIILLKSSTARLHDWAVTSYMIAGALINIFINAITPPSYVAYVGVAIVLINIYYFALFTPIRVRAVISCLFSVVVIFQAFQASFSEETKDVIVGMHLMTNVIGLSISARLYTHRRLNFKAHAEEMELKLVLSRLASIDSLTNIANRRIFSEKALEEFQRAQRYKKPVSLILIDIDRLKKINDQYGHLAGDEIIRHCAAILNEQIRGLDVAGRLGGDEFGILLPETQLLDAVTVGKRIQQRSKQEFTLTDGEKVVLSLSLGIATMKEDDQNYEDLFKRADRRLYKAKENGRNNLVFK